MKMIRKSQPSQSDVHIDRPLTNISVAYLQRAQGFVFDQVFPNIPVDKQSDKYFTFDRGMFNRDQMAKRAAGTESKGIGYTVSTDNYMCDVWALHHDIPDQRRANTDAPLQPDREATELLTHQGMIRREAEWAFNYFKAGVWATDVVGVASAPGAGQFIQWNQAASDPIVDVETAKMAMGGSTGFEPNTLVLSRGVWGQLRNHPDIVDRVKYGHSASNPAVVSLSTVAQVLEIDRIIISKAIQNTALEGAANVHSYIAGKHALLTYTTPTPGLMVPSAGYSFSWKGYTGAGSMGQRISRFRLERIKSDRVEIEMAFDQKVVAADLGYFLSGVIA